MKPFALENLSEGPQEYTRSEFTTYFDEKEHDSAAADCPGDER